MVLVVMTIKKESCYLYSYLMIMVLKGLNKMNLKSPSSQKIA